MGRFRSKTSIYLRLSDDIMCNIFLSSVIFLSFLSKIHQIIQLSFKIMIFLYKENISRLDDSFHDSSLCLFYLISPSYYSKYFLFLPSLDIFADSKIEHFFFCKLWPFFHKPLIGYESESNWTNL